MADEQIVYLSQDEDLTMVRERLQRIQSRRIVLVVPAQTQLRSHMSWKLIHSWARELSKDVLVVSGDRAIRSVVKAAGFHVADSLEASPPSKGRFGSRPGRTNAGSRTMSRLRTPPSRGREPITGSGRSTPPSQPPALPSRGATFEDEHFQVEDVGPGESLSSRPPVFGAPSKQFGPAYDYPIQPVSPVEDEDSELLLPGDVHPKDHEQAQSFLQAMQESSAASPPPPRDAEAFPAGQEVPPGATPGEDDETGAIPEHRGSVSPSRLHPPGADVTDLPTDVYVGEVEDLGDSDDLLPPPTPPYASWAGQSPDQDLEEPPGPSRAQGIRPRASRSGFVPPPPPAEEPQVVPTPIADQPTTVLPGSSPRSTGKMPATGAASRSPEPLALPQPGLVSPRPTSRTRTGTSGDRPRTPSRVPARRQAAARRGSSLPVIIAVLLFLLLIGLIFFALPSATVAVTLPSQNYPLQLKYTASASNHTVNITAHTLPAQLLTFTTTIQGQGQASGSKPVGTVQATGNVTFTNTGSGSVDIPTGTIISTQGGVNFVTTADALVLNSNPNTIQVPVKAQQAGQSGNVSANSITVIPAATKTALQQANPGITIALTVTNQQATTGGGTGSATTISQNDVSAAQAKMASQVKQREDAYLSKQVAPGDIEGKRLVVETPEASPPVGTVVTDGSFTLILHVQMSVLVVRAGTVQDAARQQFNETLKLNRPGYELAPQQPVQITKVKNVPSKDGASLALTIDTLGQIVPQVSVDQIRSLVSGKQVSAAKTALTSQQGGIPAIQDAAITVSPGFIPWVPFWQQRITVDFKTKPAPGSPTPTPTATPKK